MPSIRKSVTFDFFEAKIVFHYQSQTDVKMVQIQ